RKVLLILDNFEQVVEIAAGEVSALLRSCKGLKVLVTSRVRLDVYGEFEYQLPPMTLPPPAEQYAPDELLEYEATQLFIDRTKQHRPGFELNAGNAGAVAEICRTMDGLPLALELAAARTRRLPVEELAAMLRETSGRDWHSLLSAPYRDMPPRQQTLFNAVAWSYSLLPPEQQALLRQLSVFTGSFDWNAVTAVVRVSALPYEATLRDALVHLIDQNLVSELTPSPARWRLLEMIREFAQAQMADGERDAAAENHMNHFAARREDWYADWL